jgi:multicomponent Na+:H+ antiporter subunit G
MTGRDVAADVLLGLAVAVVLISSLGVLMMRDVYQKLHFVTPVSLIAPALVAVAVLVQQGYSQNTVETWLALLFLVVAGPFLTHATIRAARIRETGDWRLRRDGGAPTGETP